MSGLRVPSDLEAWQRWRARRTPLRSLRSRLRPSPSATRRWAWVNTSEPPRVAVGVAATTASGRAALLAPLEHLPSTPTVVYAEQDLSHLLDGWQSVHAEDVPRSVRAVLADGHYLGLGHDLWQVAQERNLPYFVVQHGLITPLAPPLAPGSTLLAWSQEDGRFWRCGREDVGFEVVGSQLLWSATSDRHAARPPVGDPPLTYLGQGHAAEIPRPRLVHAALSTCREHGAVYRPHPSERDVVSRAVLSAYARAGVTLDTSGVPLSEFMGPIVSVFSTGVLEAAAGGRDAWVDFPRPPTWLSEFWERYAMSRLGQTPTPAPPRPSVEPARRIAEIVAAAS